MSVHMSAIQSKDIVNVNDGKKIGRISDMVVNEKGEILYLVVEATKFFKRYTSFGNDANISFSQIVKFGTDVILVDL